MWSIKTKENIQPKGIKPGPHKKGYSSDSDGKESTCNLEDLGPIPGLGSFPGEGNGYPRPVFWPEEFHGLYSPWGCKELDTTEQLSHSPHTKSRITLRGDGADKRY